jgi:hypothetical protein
MPGRWREFTDGGIARLFNDLERYAVSRLHVGDVAQEN